VTPGAAAAARRRAAAAAAAVARLERSEEGRGEGRGMS